MSIKLSILVPTVPRRVGSQFLNLIKNLENQTAKYTNIEIIGLYDNKKRNIGQKRQSMLDIANGEYLVFIDDDDRITDDYVDQIMTALKDNPDVDCVVFDSVFTNKVTGKVLHCKYGVEYDYVEDKDQWRGLPAHTMVYKSSIAKKHKYDNMGYQEDVAWVKRASKDIQTQARINKVLYYYDFSVKTSEFHS